MKAIKVLGMCMALFVLAIAVSGNGGAKAAPVAAPAVYPLMDMGCNCLLGGVSGGKWLSTDTMSATVKSGQKYRVYSLNGYMGQARGTAAESMGIPCEEERMITLSPAYKDDVIASGGSWAAMPRVPRSLSTKTATYVNATADLLKARGIANPKVNIEKVLQIDLEGDRVNEVLVSASYFSASANNDATPSAEPGDYSILFMRKVVNGKVQTVVLDETVITEKIEFGAPLKYTIAGVLDLNGDGKMEIVMHSAYYEGLSSSILVVKGTTIEEVLSCGCGA